MLKTEYDEQEFYNTVRDVSRREGREEGKAEGIMESLKTATANLMKIRGISEEEAYSEAKKILSL